MSIKKTTDNGFNTTLTNTQIINLYTQLHGKYINCSQYDFEAMFTNKPTIIHWTKNKALLAYFIHDIFQKDNPDNFWSIAESIFVDSSNTFLKSLRQSFQTAYNNKNKEPKNYQELKNIYMHLL